MQENNTIISSNSANGKFTSINDIIKGTNFKDSPLGIQIANVLTEAILENHISGGDQLLELELQKEFNTSRTPIREAFRELEKRGLVEVIPRKGTFVRRITREDIEENFPVRASLEGLAAKLAFEKMGGTEKNALNQALNKMERAVQQKDAKTYWKHHVAYHEIFIHASGNDVLIQTLKTLRMHSLWYRFSYQFYREDLPKSFAVHKKIFDLFNCPATDPEKLRITVQNHIEVAFERFLAYLENHEIKSGSSLKSA